MLIKMKFESKYLKAGGNVEQTMDEFATWVFQNKEQVAQALKQSRPNQAAAIANAQSPVDVAEPLNSLNSDETGKQIITTLFNAFQKAKSGGVQKAKYGAKLEQAIKRFQGGGSTNVAPWMLRHKYVSQQYYPGGLVKIETAPTQEMLTVNQAKKPNSEYNQAMGEYDGNHLVLTGGKDGIHGVSYGYSPAGTLHGVDSTMAVNHIYNLLQKAGIKPAVPMKNAVDN